MISLSVPGRVCLFGEHSDWAAGYRRMNGEIPKGFAIIAGTNQAVHAEVRAHPSKFVFRAKLDDGIMQGPFEIPMEAASLLAAAREGGFISYAAGVAYQVLTRFEVEGLEINNTHTDLPVKKGLSSSAAVCVLVARAFNRVYGLNLSVRDEMDLAYRGEVTTPSRCGRLDQGCAYGNRPILMTFDGDHVDVHELSVPRNLHLLIVDLQAAKDTRKILSDLNQCYPFAQTVEQKAVQEYLGPVNDRLVHAAVEALARGDAEELGRLMIEAQEEFDRNMRPVCPTELEAPVLHRLLAYEPLQSLVWGGKGVGSQGDGAAQFVARDEGSRRKAIGIIRDQLGMSCLELTLRGPSRVRKAVIPAAGFGTRLFPATKAVKKELFPIVDRDGRIKPVLLTIIEEALSAGIEKIALIVQPEDRDLFERVFCAPPRAENLNRLSLEDRQYAEYLVDVGRRLTFLPQQKQEGFGHAVYCAREWVGDEPFLLLLGDHLYRSDVELSCAQQVVNAYAHAGRSVIGLRPAPGNEVHHFGCVTGSWQEEGSLLDVSELCEKPSREEAEARLRVDAMNAGEFLTVSGLYVLTAKVFDYLEAAIRSDRREQGEFQLTSCLEQLRREEGCSGLVVRGRRFDIGNPEAYLRAIHEFRHG